MSRQLPVRPRRLAAVTAPVLLAVLTMSACQPARLNRTAADAGAGGSAAAAAPTATTATTEGGGASGGGASGGGSITLTLTSPRALSGTTQAPVTCETGRIYRVSGTGTIRGYQVRIAGTTVRYTGPGSYPMTITGTIVADDGEAFALAGVRAEASINTSGGAAPFSVTGERGHTLAGSVGWSCP